MNTSASPDSPKPFTAPWDDPAAVAGAPPPEAYRPYWIPPGEDPKTWPPELRAAFDAVIRPAYMALVVGAPAGLYQSTGLTIVFLLWLELIDQLELGRRTSTRGPLPASDNEMREALINRHLRVIKSKFTASDFLLRLRDFGRRAGPLAAD